MSNYKRNTASDRDALFGSSKTKKGSSAAANRDALFGGSSSSSSTPSKKKTARPSRAATTSASSSSTRPSTSIATTSKGYNPKQATTTLSSSSSGRRGASVLTGEARAAKLKEAEEHRAKAKKAMQRGVFAKADPVSASIFYKRAADAYKQCGEDRLERIHREASADTQMQTGSYASAAADYTRAAELWGMSTEESTQVKRQEGCKLHNAAANAFQQMGETGKAAECQVNAALALLWGEESTLLSKEALAKLEEAVEAHVPDPLNRYARYRQLGTSLYVDPEANDSGVTADMLALAKQNMVTKAYAYEPLHKLAYTFCRFGEYASALYAVGAATALLEAEGIATLTLSRNYIMETILLLAMGDPVAAERAFLDWHVQKTSYLTSRECKLAEELFRAVLARDADALEEARSPEGPNRAALSNLNEVMRTLVQQLRISGVARRKGPATTSAKARKQVDDELSKELLLNEAPAAVAIPALATAAGSSQPSKNDLNNAFLKDESSESSTSEEESSHDEDDDDDGEDEVKLDSDALRKEMDDLLGDMGIGDDSDEDLSDDDIDLR